MEASQEIDLLMDTVRRFVETEMFPHEEEIDRLGHVPEEIGRTIEAKSKELGLFACNLPEEVGGGGLGYGPMSLIEREYGKTSHALQSWAARPTELLMACEGNPNHPLRIQNVIISQCGQGLSNMRFFFKKKS